MVLLELMIGYNNQNMLIITKEKLGSRLRVERAMKHNCALTDRPTKIINE